MLGLIFPISRRHDVYQLLFYAYEYMTFILPQCMGLTTRLWGGGYIYWMHEIFSMYMHNCTKEHLSFCCANCDS